MENSIINIKTKPHAILLIESKLANVTSFIRTYVKSIVGQNESVHKKIDDNQYIDMININGYTSTIKKEDILNIINRFSKTSIETIGKKFYVIRGIENATAQAINSLLKFLEEPPKDTYAILTTRNINNVLSTIKSRCHIYTLNGNKKILNGVLSNHHLDKMQIKVINNIYYCQDDVTKELSNNNFYICYNFVNDFMHNYENLESVKKLQENFSKFTYQQIELVLKIINIFVPHNKKILTLIETTKINPTKILLFNKIWTILQYSK